MNRRQTVVVMTRRVSLAVGLGLALGLMLSGCVTRMVATRIVTAPNRHGLSGQFGDPKLLAAADAFYMEAWRSPVGPPSAELAVGIVEPTDYHLVFDIKSDRDLDGNGEFTCKFDWQFPPKDGKPPIFAKPPKATLVLLHGIMMTKESMMPWALYFAQQGYRVVLVDLRGHGRSTGKWIGFGAWEADDLVKVVDELQRRGLLAGKLGVFAQSYGAVAGIQWAARDPRVAAVVALAPFSDPQTAIPTFARGFAPGMAAKLSDETFAKAEARAAAMAGFAWSGLNVTDAMKRVRVPILFFHGKFDTWILPAHSEALERAAPAGSRREVTPHDTHISLMLRLDLIGAPALAWFDERLGDSAALSSMAQK
jgi:pimeloyl-ACP methyl ester carboxylesterase